MFILDEKLTLVSPKNYAKVKQKFVIEEIKQESLVRLVEACREYTQIWMIWLFILIMC